MKARIFILGLCVFGVATAAIVSCTQKELDGVAVRGSDGEICFSTSVGDDAVTKSVGTPQALGGSGLYLTVNVAENKNNPLSSVATRAYEVTEFNSSGEDGTYDSFGVTAYMYSGKWAEQKESAELYIDGKTVSDHDGTWTFDKKVYWPGSDNLAFFAFAPFEAGEMFGLGGDGTACISYADPAVSDDGIDVSKQYDLLLAKALDMERSSGGVVPLNFSHALTAVRFVCGTMVNGEITKISLSGLSYSGTYDIEAGIWTLGSETIDYDIDVSVASASGAEIFDGATTLMMVPQQLEDVTLSIEWTSSGSSEPTTLTATLNDEWAAGSEVTYTISYAITPTNHYEEYLYAGGVQIGDRFYSSEEFDSTTTGVTEITSSGYKDFPSGSIHYFNGVYFVDSTDENGDEITVDFKGVGSIEKLIMIGTDFDKKSKVKLGTNYAFFPEPYDKITVEVVLYNLEIDCTDSIYSLVTIMREVGAVDYIAIVDCDISMNKSSYHGLIGTYNSNLNQYFTEAYISNCVCSLGPSSTSIINLGDVATGTVESLTMTNNLFYDASKGNEDDFHIFAGANSPVGKFVYNNNTVVDMNTETGAFKCASIGDVTAQYNLTYVDSPQERGYPNNYLDFVFFCIGEEGSGLPTGTTSISDNIAYHGGEVYTTQNLHWYWFKGEYEETWKAPSGFTDCQVLDEDPFDTLDVTTGTFTVKSAYSSYGYQAPTSGTAEP